MITKFKNYLNNDASDHAYVELILNVLADWIIVDETEIFKKKDLIEKLFEDLMDDELKKLLDELEKLMKENNKEEIKDKISNGVTMPDLILLDINMPIMDGITMVKNLRTLPSYKFTPILMLTTESAGDKKMAGKQAGATGWIVKPFNPEQLLKTIAKVLG